jgi:hypothetical protein
MSRQAKPCRSVEIDPKRTCADIETVIWPRMMRERMQFTYEHEDHYRRHQQRYLFLWPIHFLVGLIQRW